MSLWGDLARVTRANGEFAGWANTHMWAMLEHLRSQHNMRFLSDGRPTRATLSGLHERSFRERFGLSPEQYASITHIYDSCTAGDLPRCPPAPPAHDLRLHTFTPDVNDCCGHALRVRWRMSTVYERDDVYPAWMISKTCRTCKTQYLFDRKIVAGDIDGKPCCWHVFSPWTDGSIPPYTSNKSGHSIISTTYLRDVAIAQATTRQVRRWFGFVCRLYGVGVHLYADSTRLAPVFSADGRILCPLVLRLGI